MHVINNLPFFTIIKQHLIRLKYWIDNPKYSFNVKSLLWNNKSFWIELNWIEKRNQCSLKIIKIPWKHLLLELYVLSPAFSFSHFVLKLILINLFYPLSNSRDIGLNIKIANWQCKILSHKTERIGDSS